MFNLDILYVKLRLELLQMRKIDLNVLIAEDNRFTIQQYQRILEKNGCRVTVAYDGEECIQKFNEAFLGINSNSLEFGPFDVVLIDNNMPKKSGAEAVKEILEKCPKQRIIFASAYNINSILTSPGILMESVEILQKPFSLNTMISKIQTRRH
jgi:two-component system, cell cycle response regulator CpdR